jgi:hypothetical protein
MASPDGPPPPPVSNPITGTWRNSFADKDQKGRALQKWAGDDCADMTCYNPESPKLPIIHRYDCAGTKFNPLTGRVIRKVHVPVCK